MGPNRGCPESRAPPWGPGRAARDVHVRRSDILPAGAAQGRSRTPSTGRGRRAAFLLRLHPAEARHVFAPFFSDDALERIVSEVGPSLDEAKKNELNRSLDYYGWQLVRESEASLTHPPDEQAPRERACAEKKPTTRFLDTR